MRRFSIFVTVLIILTSWYNLCVAEGSNRMIALKRMSFEYQTAFQKRPRFPLRHGPRRTRDREKLASIRTRIPKSIGIVQIHEPGIGVNYPFMRQIMKNTRRDKPGLTNIPLNRMEQIFKRTCHVLNDLGVGWIRDIFVFRWDIIEPKKGQFDFSYPDCLIKTFQGAEIQVLPIIRFFNHWDQGHEVSNLNLKEMVDQKPRNLKAFQEFIFSLIERYDGDGTHDMPGLKYPVKYYEIGNEPSFREYFQGSPENYFVALRAAFHAIKRADPEAKVLIGGLHSVIKLSHPMLKKIEELKGHSYFDIVSYHSYGDLAGIVENYNNFKNLLEGYKAKGFWLTETATSNSALISLDQQAEEVVKRFVLGFASGCDKVIWHLLYENPTRRLVANCGLIDRNLNKKPAYYTFKLMTGKLKDFTQVETLDLREDIYAYRFERNNGDLYIMWALKKAPYNMNFSPDVHRITITEGIAYSDNARVYQKTLTEGLAELVLTPAPIYIEMGQP